MCCCVHNRRSRVGRKIWFPKIRKPRPVDHQLPLTPPQNCRAHMHLHTPADDPPLEASGRVAGARLSADFRRRGRSVSVTRVFSLGIYYYNIYTILCLYTYTMVQQNPPKPCGHNFTVISFSDRSCAVATARASCVCITSSCFGSFALYD